MYKDKIENAKLLLEALPYIKKFAGATILIKYGGSLMVNDELKTQFARDIVLLHTVGIRPIIVHGGGKEISKWMNKVGKESVFIDGLRVTDAETVELTEMVLSGKINNEVVSLLNEQGGKAVGLSGKSAGLYTAKKIKSKKDKDLGFVGEIESVDDALLRTLMSSEYIPVISSITSDGNGGTLNLNADNVAASLAKKIGAKKLIFLTDVQGIITDKKLNGSIDIKHAKKLLKHPDVKDGMLPKLTCAIDALSGVEKVHIINGTIEHAVLLELLTDTGIGTMIGEKS